LLRCFGNFATIDKATTTLVKKFGFSAGTRIHKVKPEGNEYTPGSNGKYQASIR